MPIIKSAIKRARQQEKRREHNIEIKTALKKDVKAFLAALDKKDQKDINEKLRAAISEIDRATKRGIMHKNTAARQKSSLTRAANQIVKPAKSSSSKPKTTTKPVAKATPAKKAPATKKPAAKKSPKSDK